MTDEQKNAIDHAQKILRAVKLYELAAVLARQPAAIDKEADARRLIKELRGQSATFDGEYIGPTALEQEAASFIESLIMEGSAAQSAGGDPK